MEIFKQIWTGFLVVGVPALVFVGVLVLAEHGIIWPAIIFFSTLFVLTCWIVGASVLSD